MIEGAPNFDPTDPQQPPGPGMRWDAGQGLWVPISGNPTGYVDYPSDPAPPPATTDWQRPPAATPPATTPPSGGGGGGSTVGSILAPFRGTMPGIPQGTSYLPDLPVFTPPSYKAPDAFKAPSAEDVLKAPGYQFRLGQGEQALQQSAAARGVLNTGGTLKDILGYGQNFASGEYANEYGRAADTYDRNYKSQYTDPYAIAYKGAVDAFAPKMTGYTTQAAAGQRASELGYNAAWDQYLQSFNQFRDQRDSTWSKKKDYAGS